MRKKTTIIILLSLTILLLIAGQVQADITGIDVSRWQGTMDWHAIADHVSFAIIKAGGSDAGRYTDVQFHRNRYHADVLGIPRGFYYYAGGGNPVEEAEHFAAIVGKVKPGELVVLDYEINHPNPAGYSLAFLMRTEELLGVKPLLYTNMNRVWTIDWQPVVNNGNALWGAIYDEDPGKFPNPGAWPEVAIKQYTSKGALPGITENTVDLNTFRGSIEEFQSLGRSSAPAEVHESAEAAGIENGEQNENGEGQDKEQTGEQHEEQNEQQAPAGEGVSEVTENDRSAPARVTGFMAAAAKNMLVSQFYGSSDDSPDVTGEEEIDVFSFKPKHPSVTVTSAAFNLFEGLVFGDKKEAGAVENGAAGDAGATIQDEHEAAAQDISEPAEAGTAPENGDEAGEQPEAGEDEEPEDDGEKKKSDSGKIAESLERKLKKEK
ncbi:MAG: glycoside hydrolase family 25 protein [Thermoleophilia bacterium]|nr:glycoside hydrolase family 25 protein [Thermoleophilia bacterium]